MSDNAKQVLEQSLIGGSEKREICVVDYDPNWQRKFRKHEKIVRQALGDRALLIEHVGSTSVPGLAAKPIIDIILVVAHSGNEPEYLPALEAAGYILRVREPDWHEHRMVRTPERDVHIHIYSKGCVEIGRMLRFRDRLRSNAEDRMLYENKKRELAKQDWPDTNYYARAKSEVVKLIILRACEAKQVGS
jgi:GrpB-like predicted nucleotidyltransferase (UPF0157 family)